MSQKEMSAERSKKEIWGCSFWITVILLVVVIIIDSVSCSRAIDAQEGGNIFRIYMFSLIMLAVVIITGVVYSKASKQWKESMPEIEMRAIIKSRKRIPETESSIEQFELSFETEQNIIQTHMVLEHVYNSVAVGDVGMLTYKEDCFEQGKFYFIDFKREGQGTLFAADSESADDNTQRVCSGCGADITQERFSTNSACEYCGRKF